MAAILRQHDGSVLAVFYFFQGYRCVKNTSEYKIASEMPVPHSLGKYFQHHEIQKYCISINFRILSEHCQLYKGPNNVQKKDHAYKDEVLKQDNSMTR